MDVRLWKFVLLFDSIGYYSIYTVFNSCQSYYNYGNLGDLHNLVSKQVTDEGHIEGF